MGGGELRLERVNVGGEREREISREESERKHIALPGEP